MEENNISIYKKYGIYGIRNKMNDMVYVGKTINNFGDRWDCHKAQLRGGYHSNHGLQEDWNKYGEDNFEFQILHECNNSESLEELNALEIEFINSSKEIELAYNVAPGGDQSMYRGKHLSEETKRKIGEKNRVRMTGRKASEETKTKMSESQKRRYENWTKAERMAWGEKVGKQNKGRKWTDEQRAKMKGNKNGSKYTVEDVKLIRKLREVDGLKYKQIAELTKIPERTVYLIATYKRWKDIA